MQVVTDTTNIRRAILGGRKSKTIGNKIRAYGKATSIIEPIVSG
jgi:hypothetical protein